MEVWRKVSMNDLLEKVSQALKLTLDKFRKRGVGRKE